MPNVYYHLLNIKPREVTFWVFTLWYESVYILDKVLYLLRMTGNAPMAELSRALHNVYNHLMNIKPQEITFWLFTLRYESVYILDNVLYLLRMAGNAPLVELSMVLHNVYSHLVNIKPQEITFRLFLLCYKSVHILDKVLSLLRMAGSAPLVELSMVLHNVYSHLVNIKPQEITFRLFLLCYKSVHILDNVLSLLRMAGNAPMAELSRALHNVYYHLLNIKPLEITFWLFTLCYESVDILDKVLSLLCMAFSAPVVKLSKIFTTPTHLENSMDGRSQQTTENNFMVIRIMF